MLYIDWLRGCDGYIGTDANGGKVDPASTEDAVVGVFETPPSFKRASRVGFP